MLMTAGGQGVGIQQGGVTMSGSVLLHGSMCTDEECERLGHFIEQRAGGLIHQLRVGCMPNGPIVVSGVVGSHYIRQLVLAAVAEALGRENLGTVRLDIQVRRKANGSRFKDGVE
jgi:hypothetical protein